MPCWIFSPRSCPVEADLQIPPSELRRFFCEIVTIERRTARFRFGQAEQPLLSSQDGNAVSKQHVPCRRDCEVCLENKGSAEPPRVPPNQLSQEGNWKLVFSSVAADLLTVREAVKIVQKIWSSLASEGDWKLEWQLRRTPQNIITY